MQTVAPIPAFTLAHTAALTTSDTHTPQRAYGGSEAHLTLAAAQEQFDTLANKAGGIAVAL